MLHAGTPTPLAVTVLADFSGRVMAEVEYDNNKVSQTEDFQGGNADVTFFASGLFDLERTKASFYFSGLTRILTLPPVSLIFLLFLFKMVTSFFIDE